MTIPNDPQEQKDFLQKLVDFQDLMRKMAGNEGPVEEGEEQCPSCKSAICAMIQKTNKELLCHLKYSINYKENTLTIIE